MGYIQFVKKCKYCFKNLLLLVELALALVGIKAYVEEVFPFVNALKTIRKNQFIIETVKESLLIKTYFPGVLLH